LGVTAVAATSPRAFPAALWLAMGTFTALPVPPPSHVDRKVAGTAMALAPAAGVLLAVPAVAVVAAGRWLSMPELLPAVLAIGLLALMTRGLHLDGLADTADGLAASYDRDRALHVMRRGDTGPAGTATLVLVLLAQVAALAAATAHGHGPLAIAVAVVAGRGVVSLTCVRGVPAARPEGLGATVAGTVAVPVAAGIGVVVTAIAALAATVLSGLWWLGPAGVAAGYVVAALLLRRTVRRLGGVTGDVIGACLEAATTATLIAVALA
jgi:adenosylcobinamide-GDP ribazoletransferase